jgi:hypothetical protein
MTVSIRTRIILTVSLLACLLGGGFASASDATILIEAESFQELGGWVVDTQPIDQMGSPYLLAHGLGRPVQDASTTIEFAQQGEYRVWVRTRDWVGPWKTNDTGEAMAATGSPGVFRVLMDGEPLETTFGVTGDEWHWQNGGTIDIDVENVELTLTDLTGFDGRCDAILFTQDLDFTPPNTDPAMRTFRNELLGFSDDPTEAGEYDLVVVGGGMAGCCTAVSAARYGCRVALIQNRPVLGGNNSSEVRVGLSGLIHQAPYTRLGDLVDEIGPVGHWNVWEANRDPDSLRSLRIREIIAENPEKTQHNAGPPTNYEDQHKANVVLAEENIDLYLNMHASGVEMNGDRIVAVLAQNTRTGERFRFASDLFADCTGDGNIGVAAGADFRVGRESIDETEEGLAPEEADELVMGTSVQWYSVVEEEASDFPACPWAVQFDETNCTRSTRGDWDWETGARRDQVDDIEQIRDYALRVVYGNWAVLKNHESFQTAYAKRRLEWVAYVGGKRESRRLLGDIVLKQQDIVEGREFEDACVTTTWTIDLHYPKTPACACEAFRSEARHLKIEPYPIPYRCLYSRNIDNLMMAGRNISVTHVALGTVRVQRTTGMMGEVLGMAASLCVQHDCDPRGVYDSHLPAFREMLEEGVPASKNPESPNMIRELEVER